MRFKPLLTLDFDGVLHNYNGVWTSAHTLNGRAIPGAMNFLRDVFLDKRMDVAIYSSRSSHILGRMAMKRWMKRELGLAFSLEDAIISYGDLPKDIYHYLKWPWFKPACRVFIDDRAHLFTGTLPPIQELIDFKPWNRQDKKGRI